MPCFVKKIKTGKFSAAALRTDDDVKMRCQVYLLGHSRSHF